MRWLIDLSGRLDEEGHAYKLLPDNAFVDMTPYVAGNDYYTFNDPPTEYNPFISLGDTNIWWFNGESPSGYTMQTTASVSGAPGGATFAWSISGPAAIVGSSTNSSVTVTNTGPSVSPGDVVVKVVVAGAAICQTNLTVLAPKSLNLLSNYDQPFGDGYVSEIHYQILDQFNHVLPHTVPWNEDIDANGVPSTSDEVTAASKKDYCIANGDPADENWHWGEEEGDPSADPNNCRDRVGANHPPGSTVPDTLHPQTPLSGVKVTHSPSGGSFHVGSDTAGKGVLVKTLKWQKYQDHGRHE